MILTSNYSRIAIPSGLEVGRSFKRSWWVSSGGKVIDSEDDHAKALRQHTEKFGIWSHAPQKGGFARVGFSFDEFFTESFNLSRSQIAAIQEIYDSLGTDVNVEINLRSKGMQFTVSRIDFLDADTEQDLIKAKSRF